MWLPFLISALPISLADLRTFTVPNIYLWWLSLLCTPHLLLNGLGQISNLIFVMLLLVFLYLLGLGMGDVKLIAMISLSLNSDIQANLSFLALLILLSACSYVIVKTLWDHEVPRRIPLAPSIFVGLTLYLATS
jgi:prepilin signal peptidase PulO-like enzyme (type II secretory pathway)